MSADLDPIMIRVRAVFENSGISLEELGRRIGYPEDTARKSAWQFVRRTNDPRLSMLRRFATAMGMELSEMFREERPGPRENG